MLQHVNKDDLYLRFKQIAERLITKHIELMVEEEISPEPIVFFHSFFTEDGFEHDLLNDIDEFYEAIRDFEYHELDDKKVRLLKNHFIDRLQNPSVDVRGNAQYQHAFQNFTDAQKQQAEGFIRKQTEIKKTLIENLRDAAVQAGENIPKVKWKGNLLHFAELLIELEDKGWLKGKSRLSLVNAVCSGFDFSETQDNPNHETAVRSIYRNMHSDEKPRHGGMKTVFSKLYYDGYDAVFGGILSNPSDNQTLT